MILLLRLFLPHLHRLVVAVVGCVEDLEIP
jgi:hypothetical protein